MNEDYGNLDQMNFFIPYAFNAGAAVVAFRPIGNQPNEVVLDNDSPGVKFLGQWFNSRSAIYFGRAGGGAVSLCVAGQDRNRDGGLHSQDSRRPLLPSLYVGAPRPWTG